MRYQSRIVMKQIFFLFLSCFISLNNLNAQESIFGYFFQYQPPTEVQYEYITDLVFCSIHGDSNGNLITSGFSQDPSTGFDPFKFSIIKDNTTQSSTNLWLKVGGIDYNNTINSRFDTIIKDSIKLNAFTNQLVSFANDNGVFGLIFHLENNGDSKYLNQQLLFLDSLNSKINHSVQANLKIGLHIKGHSSQELATDKVHPKLLSSASNLIDFWFIEPAAVHFSNSISFTPINDAKTNVNAWETAGVPSNKMVLGISFEATTLDHQNFVRYDNLNGQGGTHIQNNSSTVYYYNGKHTVQKKQDIASNKGMKGVFIWNVVADREKGDYSLLENIQPSRRDFCPYLPVLGETHYLDKTNGTVLTTLIDGSDKTFNWSFENTPIPGNDSAITVFQTGNYSVTVNYEKGCSITDSVYVDSHVGYTFPKKLNFAHWDSENRVININSPFNENYDLSIYSIDGKLMYSNSKIKENFSINKLNTTGTYIIRLINSKNMYQQKLIIH